MKSFYRDNKIVTMMLLGISLTFWGAIFCLPILGVYQLGLTISYYSERDKMKIKSKKRFNLYITTLISLIIATLIMTQYKYMHFGIYILWLFVGFVLALIHLSISYKINIQHEF